VSDRALTVEARIPTALAPVVADKLALAARSRVADRLREADATLWGPPGTPEISNRLGWLTIAERMAGEVGDFEAFAEGVRDQGFRDVVLLGMGGSSLAPEVLHRSFGHQPGRLRLHVLDSTDAATIRAVEETVDPKHTLFLVSSKSGGTIEPLSLFAHFWSVVRDGRNFVAITDPGSGLAGLATEHGFRRTFLGDPDIGGRYSALSPFGLLPGALMGVDIGALLAGARAAWDTAVGEHPAAVWLGVVLSALAIAPSPGAGTDPRSTGRDKLTFLIPETLPGLGLWLEQLVAESTGKLSTGILPVAEEPLGEAGVYGEDRLFVYLPNRREPDPALDARVDALAGAGAPLITIPTDGPGDLGRIFMLFEIAVAVAGWGLEINPFDQPNVQQAKDATKRVLAGYEAGGELAEATDAEDAGLGALLADAAPPDYVAIMAYVEPSADFDDAAAELRSAIRDARKTATTFGYGPRFLHSTGQFHKGGPRTGRFLQLLHDGPADVDIPGAPYTFTTLKNAQAIGDLSTLRELGLPAERVRLQGDDPAAALRGLTARIKRVVRPGQGRRHSALNSQESRP
jgi:transaldolase/glucose-6-phosphate isomerase